jgi:adenosylcobinamide-GDP ribazoletransferase
VTGGNWFTGFLAAVQFLTVAPPLVRRPFTDRELGWSVGWFPLVGVLLGGALAGINWLLGFAFAPAVTAALVLTAWVLATGALHLDGFLDSCDGLFGGHTPEARLRIMRDERAGAFAVIGGVLLLLLKFATLVSLSDRLVPLLMAPVLGRWGVSLAVVGFPYGRPDGLGRVMKDHAGWRQAVLASGVALGSVAAAAVTLNEHWRPPLALILAAVGTWGVSCFVLRRLPGLTGDVYGMLCEVLEVVVLLAFAAGGSHVA